MTQRLESRHLDILRNVARADGPVRTTTLDGRLLRSLRTQGLVTERAGTLTITAAGLRTLSAALPAEMPRPDTAPKTLSDSQADLLRQLCRQREPALADHLDGRVIRALQARGFVAETEGWVSATPAGLTYFENHVRRRRRSASGGEVGAGRGEVILRALDAIELAIPRNAEVRVGGDTLAYADDVIKGLREFARRIDQKTTDPRH